MEPAKLSKPIMPQWAENGVLYEINVRQYSSQGNLAGVEHAIPKIKSLGADILWLMPIFPIGEKNRKGSLGSPYSVRDYQRVNPDYGTLDDLKKLVSTAHAQGLKVILDWVPNHTSWDNVWMDSHPDFYTKYKGEFTVPLNEHGEPIPDWSDVVDLDYGNPNMRKAMVEAMTFWIKNADIDGFRVDMAGLVPNDFWAEASAGLNAVKPVFMLAEWQDEPDHFTSCFHANYGWKFKDVTKEIWAGTKNALALDSLKMDLDRFYPKDYSQLYFTQNHDENTWNGTEAELYGASADAINVLAFTWQGMPMIYGGQEGGMNKRLPFFEKQAIQWIDPTRFAFFEKLCLLKHQNPALNAGPNGGALEKINTNKDESVYAFTRSKGENRVIVVLNLSKSVQTVALSIPKEAVGPYTSVFTSSTISVPAQLELTLKPWDYLVLNK